MVQNPNDDYNVYIKKIKIETENFGVRIRVNFELLVTLFRLLPITSDTLVSSSRQLLESSPEDSANLH